MRVLLVCGGGMSTSILAVRMRNECGPGDAVDAVGLYELEAKIDHYDVVMIGPQIGFEIKRIEAITVPRRKKFEIIERRTYGMMDGKSVMDRARALLA
ncbi:MAG: hypothetical protein QM708_13845 [Propioniciclava sp.]|uniref:hypothetical protein n=1 Tax=Propioniciclava sp. TaxID=2038686 RepID=UPI0039E3B45A